MKYCSKCGAPVPDGASFCNKCGAPVPASQQSAPAQEPASPLRRQRAAAKPTFCRVCGTQIPASAKNCPNCGAAVSTPAPAAAPAPKTAPAPRAKTAPSSGKNPMPILIALAAAVVIAVIVLVVVLVSRPRSTPASEFVSYNKSVASDILSVFSNTTHNATKPELHTDLTISASADTPAISSILNSATFTSKVDISGDRALINAQASLLGSTVLNATVTYENGKLGLYLPELDGGYYTLDIGQLLRDDANEMGYYTSDRANIASVQLLLDTVRQRSGDLPGMVQPYLDALMGIVNDQNVTCEQNVPVTLQRVQQQPVCTVYTFKPREEDISNLVVALANQLERDGSLRSLLKDIFAGFLEYFPDYFAGSPYESDPGSYIDEQFSQAASALRESAPNIAQQFCAQEELTWTLAVENGQIRYLCIDLFDRYTNTNDSLVYESAFADGQTGESLYLFNGGIVPLYERMHTQTDSGVSGMIRLYDNIGNIGSLGYYYSSDYLAVSYDIQSGKTSPLGIPYGDYTVSYSDGYGQISLSVHDGANGGVDHVLILDELFGGSYNMPDHLELTVNATSGTSAAWPNVAPVDVTNYSDEEMSALFGSIVDSMQGDVLGNLMGLFGRG